jgi:hypothetical protein
MVLLLVVLTWVHHHFLWSDQYFCLVPTTYESIILEHLNKLVVEPSMTFLFSPYWRYSYWTFGINVGNLWEPSLCHHEVCVLDVGSDFLSLIHVQLMKDVAVNLRRFFFVSSGIISKWSWMCGLFLRWQVVASIFLKTSYMHTKPLTDLFKNEKNSKTFTIFFPIRTRLCFIAISSCWCNFLVAIAILLIFLELYTIVHILRIQQPYLSAIR